MYRLRRLRARLSCLCDFCVGRFAREVEALRGTECKLRPRRQIYARRVRQTSRNVTQRPIEKGPASPLAPCKNRRSSCYFGGCSDIAPVLSLLAFSPAILTDVT